MLMIGEDTANAVRSQGEDLGYFLETDDGQSTAPRIQAKACGGRAKTCPALIHVLAGGCIGGMVFLISKGPCQRGPRFIQGGLILRSQGFRFGEMF